MFHVDNYNNHKLYKLISSLFLLFCKYFFHLLFLPKKYLCINKYT